MALAAVLIVWLSAALVRVENERYALQMGMCWNESLRLPDLTCVEKSQTRTGWWWHLFHALTD